MDTSVYFPGVGTFDGHMDVMDTEIDSAVFFHDYPGSGVFGRLGNGYGADLERTLGAMAELPDDPYLAHSFTDLFFDIQDIPGWFLPPLYNQSPMRVEAIIDGNPPLSTDFVFEGCLPLYTSPIPGEGDSVCNMVSVIFRLPNAVNVFAWPTGSTTLQRGDALFFTSDVHNLLANPVEGDIWISVLRPDASEIVVPESFMNHSNPLHGQVDSELSLRYEIEVPQFAPYGSYQLIARIGTYPDNYVNESIFDFDVVE